jgi:hypothetical protein
MANINLQDYYNRWAKEKNWEKLLVLAGRFIQSAEINEMQDVFSDRLKGLGDALYRDGDIVSGCEIAIDAEASAARMGEGRVYLNGAVRELPAATLAIPFPGTVDIGVILRSRLETEIEDGGLRDPAVGCPAYGQPGAARLIVTAEWGLGTDTPSGSHEFCRIYTVTDGEVSGTPSASGTYMDEFLDALARYDRESNGFYIISGLSVTVQDAPEGKQAFSVAEGKAHIQGYEVSIPYSKRLVVDEAADVLEAIGEPHIYSPAGGSMRIDVSHKPIDTITGVGVTKEKTVNVVHGNYSGAADPLPDTSIVQLLSVKQSSTTYAQNDDYKLVADRVDWSPGGAEPAPGSTYEVKYQYRTTAEPENPDTSGFTVSGLVDGSLILVDYTYRMPRRDLIVLERDGAVSQVKGIPHRYAPVYPQTPPGVILLARVEQDWTGNPAVRNVATRAMRMDKIEAMERSIIRLHDLVSIERLKTDALINAPTAVHGVFVDPFIDDDLRDAGLEQTAAVMAGELSLPYLASVSQFPASGAVLLGYTLEKILEQPYRTNEMPINPYQAFEPLPGRVALDPSVDRWNLVETLWASEITKYITSGRGNASSTSTSTITESLGEDIRADTVMRVRDVAFTAEGFGPGEAVASATFDGLPVNIGVSAADAQGRISGAFTIPSGVNVGVKLFQINGAHSVAMGTYTGTGTITAQIQRRATTVTTRLYSVDPLAETFILPAARHIESIEVFFTAKGATPVRLQIRETAVGMPTSEALAEAELKPGEIAEGAVNRFTFERPVYLRGGIVYAIVIMTDSADHKLAIARLEEYDSANGWVKAQPFQAGVLLSSSNANTWTPHQDADLWFRMYAAVFSAAPKKVRLGEVTADGTTDILPLAEVDYPSGLTDVTFVISEKQTGAEIARVQPGQLLSMPEAITGDYCVDAELAGESTLSPVLYDGAQFVMASLQQGGSYISRAFPCGADKELLIRVEALLPGSSNIRVYAQTGASAWTEAELGPYDEAGDGWRRYDYLVPCDRAETRVKIELAGTPAERPRARALRAVVLDA